MGTLCILGIFKKHNFNKHRLVHVLFKHLGLDSDWDAEVS